MASDGPRGSSNSEQEIAAAVQEVVDGLAGELEDLAGRLTQHLYGEIPALRELPELAAEVEETVIASLRGWLGTVRHGLSAAEVAPAAEVLAIVQTWVLRGAPLPALLRAFHVGHGFLVREVVVEIPEEERTPELLGAVLQRLLTLSFAYIDALTAHVVDVYTSERARLVRGADAVRADAARRVLSGAEIDVDAVSRDLGYELRRWHVGMLLWGDAADQTRRSAEPARGRSGRDRDGPRLGSATARPRRPWRSLGMVGVAGPALRRDPLRAPRAPSRRPDQRRARRARGGGGWVEAQP